MDLYFVILGILFFIFGLLQIILFFKLWAMTNNVKKIAQGNDSPHVDWQLRACVLTGDMDRAKKLISVILKPRISSALSKSSFANALLS